MAQNDEGSVSLWIVNLKAGHDAAARQLWDRYFAEMVRLARTRLGVTPRTAADEEDVALSAFRSLCAGAARGDFPDLDDRDELWRLLVTITIRKALDQIERQGRQKRGGPGPGGSIRTADVGVNLDWLEGREPSPEVVAILAEEHRRMFECLRDDSLRRVAELRLEGYTGAEIAEQLGCTRRTVVRKLEVIRQTWSGFER
jgi:DNA-directed RNA polymerase specialized sigma24 family protein